MANREPVPFGVLLLHLRAAAGLTQEQLAARAGLSPNAIAALERGKRRAPRTVTVERLIAALRLEAPARDELVAAAQAPVRGAEAPDEVRDERVLRDARRHAWWPVGAGEPTPLVDREHELDTILRLVGDERVRLLTLTGPAGVGKTRLALAAASRLTEGSDRFADGVLFVDLSPVRDPHLVLNSLAAALGLLDAGSRSPLERLVDLLVDRQQLLVLDNFEQVLAAAESLADLLAACPRLALLVTSRVPLQLRREQTFRIAPLPVPDFSAPLPSLEELAAIPSVALFVQRACARQSDFVLSEKQVPIIARLVSALDGLPLALELAAARTATLSLPMIASRLGDRLRLLRWTAGDVPERQQSLEAAVGWSYDLLAEDEQRLFRCLGVFAGRVALAAVAAVARGLAVDMVDADLDDARTLDQLTSLAEQSLILPMPAFDAGWSHAEPRDSVGEQDSEPAFGILETMRAYAEERLAERDELTAARRAHAHFYVALAEHADVQLRRTDQGAWYLRLEREHDNLRAALRWLLDQDDPAEREAAIRLAGALRFFWRFRCHYGEGSRWLEEALARAPDGRMEPAGLAACTRALLTAGWLRAYRGGDFAQARAFLEEGLALARQRQDPEDIAQGLTSLGICPLWAGEPPALPLLEEAVLRARGLGEPHLVGVSVFNMAMADQAQGRAGEAAARHQEALACLEAAGDLRMAGAAHVMLASLLSQQGERSAALHHLRDGLAISTTLRDRTLLGHCARAVLAVVDEGDDPVERVRLLGAADALDLAMGAGRAAWERVTADRRASALRAHLTETTWETAYREGRSLTAEAIVRLAMRLLGALGKQLAQAPEGPSAPLVPTATAVQASQHLLSAREQEVLRLVAQGRSTKAVGRELFISERTVAQHVKAIFNKLGVDTRAQAVAVAVRRGLL